MDNKFKKGNELNQSILKQITLHFFMNESYQNMIEGVQVFGYTEYNFNGLTYRAHPSYKNESSWFDWVMIAWNIPETNNQSSEQNKEQPEIIALQEQINESTTNNHQAMLIPARLVCIIKDWSIELYAIIHSCLQYRKKYLFCLIDGNWSMKISKHQNCLMHSTVSMILLLI